MNLPEIDVRNETACYQALVDLLHPQGLVCPGCGSREGWRVHRSRRAPVVDYRCTHCRHIFNAWTGTVLQRTRLPPSILWRLLRALVHQENLAELAREAKLSRSTVMTWEARLRQWLRAAEENANPRRDSKRCKAPHPR